MPGWQTAISVFMLSMLLALWISSFFPEERLWGINHWAYYPLWLRSLVIGLGILVFVPELNRRLRNFLTRTVVSAFRSLMQGSKHLGYVSIALASLALFYLLRTRIPLLGDGFQITENLDAGSLSVNWSQPLAIWIYLTAYSLLHKLLHLDGVTLYALISYFSGAAFVIFALRLSMLLGKGWSARLLVFLVLALMGSTQLFLGYAEHYPLLYTGVLVYLFYSLKSLRGESKVLIPGAIFILLLPLHFSSLYLLPSAAFLLFLSGQRKGLVKTLRRIKTWGLLLFLVLMFAALAIYIHKYNWYVFSYIVPPLHGGYSGPGYTLFSPSHLLDFLNQQLLVSPIGLALLLVLLIFKSSVPAKSDRTFQFLLIVSAGQVLFNFLVNPGLGAPRDWDLFGSVGLGYTVLALYLFGKLTTRSGYGYLKLGLVTAALLFTLPWVLINADGDMSVARFRNLLDLDPKRSRNGHFILAGYFDSIGRPDEVDRENGMIKTKLPEVEAVNQAFFYLREGKLEPAYESINRALQISADFPEAHSALGLYCLRTGDLQGAETAFKRTLQLQPDHRSAYARLGDVYIKIGEFEKARAYYTRSLRLGVNDPEVFSNLGIICAQYDEFSQAASFYRRAIAENKDFPQAHYGLAYACCQLGELEEALREINLLLRIAPDFELAYQQLGQIYESLGRKQDAASAYERYLKMRPDDPEAGKIRQTIERLRRN